jgi:hypothetical protein
MNVYRFIGAGILHTIESGSDDIAIRSARFITERLDVVVFRQVGRQWARIALPTA